MGRILIYKIKDLIKYAYILPTYALCAADMAWTAYTCYHCAHNPDISWKRRYNEPFNAYRNSPYKLWMSDKYRENHVCRAPLPPCYLTPEEEKQQNEEGSKESAPESG